MTISRYVVMEVNYDHEILVNYIILCYITCMLMYGKVCLFLSYELTKLYSLLCFIFHVL
ncbi:hypothetical protein F383_21847 [Gossypium arboreum]|uniref:Uncharacterized protein n=1 Tax=Gossypium arboreum TaxID=29729 RepID=A0A0B0NXE0_GOSAR|nr:hypothetical protein F383_21847 [Gossypium arboreum]